MITDPEDDDEEEHFVDAPDPDAPTEEVEKAAPVPKKWGTAYDGLKRQPEYANAQGSCLWEIVSALLLFVICFACFVLFCSAVLCAPFF